MLGREEKEDLCLPLFVLWLQLSASVILQMLCLQMGRKPLWGLCCLLRLFYIFCGLWVRDGRSLCRPTSLILFFLLPGLLLLRAGALEEMSLQSHICLIVLPAGWEAVSWGGCCLLEDLLEWRRRPTVPRMLLSIFMISVFSCLSTGGAGCAGGVSGCVLFCLHSILCLSLPVIDGADTSGGQLSHGQASEQNILRRERERERRG
jgi:hypothetical protein